MVSKSKLKPQPQSHNFWSLYEYLIHYQSWRISCSWNHRIGFFNYVDYWFKMVNKFWACKVDKPIFFSYKQFCISVSTSLILEWFFRVWKLILQHLKKIKKNKNHKFWRQDYRKFYKARFSSNSYSKHRSTYFQFWETKTLVQIMPFSRNPNPCPFCLFFPSSWMWQLHVWFFMVISITLEMMATCEPYGGTPVSHNTPVKP